MQLSKYELEEYVGGAFNATFLNAIVRGFTFIFDLGKAIGSSISRAINHAACTYN